MVKYMMRKRPIKDIVALSAIGIGTSLGAKSVSSVGGDASGLGAVAGFNPVLGNLVGTKMTLGALSDMDIQFKKDFRKLRR